jgi:hypothetical protein
MYRLLASTGERKYLIPFFFILLSWVNIPKQTFVLWMSVINLLFRIIKNDENVVIAFFLTKYLRLSRK